MTQENETRLLFQRYAEEVGSYLPRRKRKDIQLEILSLLEDSLEDLSARQGRPADEDMALELLKTYGAPIIFARAYRPDDNLMRPETFQLFKLVAAVVGGALLLELLLSIGLSTGKAGVDYWAILGEWFEGIFTAFGILVLSFASIERTTPAEWFVWPFEQMAADWDPAGLKARVRKKMIKPGEQWFETIILAGLIVLFTIFPQWVGIGAARNGEWFFLPVLAESLQIYLPWILSFWLARLVFSVSLSRQIYWNTQMRFWDLALNAFGVGLLYALLVGPPLIGLNPAYAALHNTPPEVQTWVTNSTVVTFYYVVVGLNLVTKAASLVWKAIRLLRNRASINVWGVRGSE